MDTSDEEPVEGRPLEERQLIDRARRGDVRAFEGLVQRHQQVAFRAAYLIAGRTGDAEDAAQEAFIKAFHALPRFRSEAPFRPWLLAIVANEARNRVRSATRRNALAERAGRDRPSGDTAPSPEAAALASDQQEQLVQALLELEEGDRLVIAYRYFFDMGEADMAIALGCARGTVKSRLSRAIARLRVVIEGPEVSER